MFCGMNSTITDQMDQTEKPMCSATMDQIRLRRAILLPPFRHASRSSASHAEMCRARRCAAGGAGVSVAG
jgi:hypothetical protein